MRSTSQTNCAVLSITNWYHNQIIFILDNYAKNDFELWIKVPPIIILAFSKLYAYFTSLNVVPPIWNITINGLTICYYALNPWYAKGNVYYFPFYNN